jgi:cytochrome c oxidase subunit 2
MKKIFFVILFLLVSFFHTKISLFANGDSSSSGSAFQSSFNQQRDFSEKRMTFQEPASTSMVEVVKLHKIMFFVMIMIFFVVCALLFFIIFKFKESNGHKTQNFTHNIKLEIFWTSVPFIIIVFLAALSLKSLKKLEKLEYSEKSDVTLKIVGHQWYWTYEYPEYGIKFDSYMKGDKDLLPGDKRLLSTDNVIYLPENKNIKLIVTADDVIHSWTIPAFGVKKDCVPGRLNETWFKPTKQGVFYGQCSELCGVLHGFMPIEVKVVGEKEFENWTQEAKKTFPI